MRIEMDETEVEVSVFVMIDADGDYRTGHDDSSAMERFEEDIAGSGPRRMVKVILKMKLPTVPVLTGTVPNDGTAELSVIA